MVHMCHLFMPKMVEKKRGIVINLSSITAIRPSSLLTVYGSTKVHHIGTPKSSAKSQQDVSIRCGNKKCDVFVTCIVIEWSRKACMGSEDMK